MIMIHVALETDKCIPTYLPICLSHDSRLGNLKCLMVRLELKHLPQGFS